MIKEKKFIFGVITYNHSKYIVEHLESIKYLINKYGNNYSFKIVLADDGSMDNTVMRARSWLSENNNLFESMVILSDGVNRGTCLNYTNLWEHIDSPLFKITAGDDVYSFLNIIEEAENLEGNDFISGIPLMLINGRIKKSVSTIVHMLATDVIYRNKKFIDRMKQISVINTPSLLYNIRFIKNENLFKFIRKFKVVEDFPMHVKIAEDYKSVRFKQVDKVYIYYRRTGGSTYLVRGSEFEVDKLNVFRHMLLCEKSLLDRIMLKNRISCFLSESKVFRAIFNFNYYVYFIRFVFNFFEIIRIYKKLCINVKEHQLHYLFIKGESDKFLLDKN